MRGTPSGWAVDADAAFAAARYNLSFVLSQLGDFDGALRETRQALELEPLYVPQKFSLTIDLQYENPNIAIAPDLAADVAGEALAGEFAFDPPALDQLFAELTPATPAAPSNGHGGDALDLARSYSAKGLLDLASAELSRAAARGASAGATSVLMGDIFAKRGLYGEALDRYRAARAATPDDPDATLGEIRALVALGAPADAAPLADALPRASTATSRCWWPGPASGSLWATPSVRSIVSARRRRGARPPRPLSSSGAGLGPARRPCRGARRLQCRAPARPFTCPGAVRAGRAGGRAGQLDRCVRSVRARPRPAADLRRGGSRAG